MRVGLVQLPHKSTLPLLSLMHLSSWHKALGDEVIMHATPIRPLRQGVRLDALEGRVYLAHGARLQKLPEGIGRMTHLMYVAPSVDLSSLCGLEWECRWACMIVHLHLVTGDCLITKVSLN